MYVRQLTFLLANPGVSGWNEGRQVPTMKADLEVGKLDLKPWWELLTMDLSKAELQVFVDSEDVALNSILLLGVN
jgi:hypothetical protein